MLSHSYTFAYFFPKLAYFLVTQNYVELYVFRYHCDAGSARGAKRIPNNKSLFLTIETDSCAGTDTGVRFFCRSLKYIVNSSFQEDVKKFYSSWSNIFLLFKLDEKIYFKLMY